MTKPWGRPDAATAAVRVAVRAALTDAVLADHESDAVARPLVLVACSGGADSLALAAATSVEAGAAGVRAGAVVVDHGLQPGSGEVAARAAQTLRSLGLDPVDVEHIQITGEEESQKNKARNTR